jgi:small subunit ribosomal protein S20
MANHKSALRKYKRDEKKRLINKMNMSKMRNKIKKLRKFIEEGKTDEGKKLLPEVISVIDKTVSKGAIHKKTGSRYKSRLTLLVQKG